MSRTDSVTGEFYQTHKDKFIAILLKVFQKIEKEGTLPNSYYKAYYTDTKTRKRQYKEKLQTNISDEYRCKNPQKLLANLI